MPLSTFNQYLQNYPADGKILVHNTLSGAYVVLEADEMRLLREIGHEEQPEHCREIRIKHDLDDTNVGVFVTSLAQEEREFQEWFAFRRAQREVMEVTVGLNLACNFDCSYCCQAKVMNGSVMSKELCKDTADWIVSRAIAAKVKSVHLVFVGGEPLLHPDRLIQVASRVKQNISEHNIGFSFALLTNGYFLSREMLETLLPLGLVRAQVTLDGDASTHSISRISKKHEDTFQRIFDNCIEASSHIEVAINGNYQEDTIAGFVPLLDMLKSKNFPKNSPVHFGPALQATSSKDNAKLASSWSASPAESQIRLYDQIIAHGFSSTPPNQVGPCEFHEHHAFAIGSDGAIFKCPGFFGHASWSIGHVQSGLTSAYQTMIQATPQSQCGGCSHRPNCGGGCVAEAMIKAKQPSGVLCERSFFNRSAHQTLPRMYRDALGLPPLPPQSPPKQSASSTAKRGRRSTALRIL